MLPKVPINSPLVFFHINHVYQHRDYLWSWGPFKAYHCCHGYLQISTVGNLNVSIFWCFKTKLAIRLGVEGVWTLGACVKGTGRMQE